MKEKEKILDCIRAACSYAEELDVDIVKDTQFAFQLDKNISELFNKLENRVKLDPSDIILQDNYYGIIKKNIRMDVMLRSIMNQMIEYALFNFDNKLEVADNEGEVIKSIASTVNMMGEELKEKIAELQKKNIELETVSKELAIKNQNLKSMTKAIDTSSLVSITDLDGKITRVNRSFCETSKYRRKELLGRNHRLFNSGHHTEEFWEQMWQTITNGDTWRAEVKNKAKDGTEYWVDTVIIPLKDIEDKTTHYLSIRNVITDKKSQEEKLINNSIIIKESLKEKEVLLQEIHHRVKNNLQIIAGLINLQIKRTDSAEAAAQLNESQRRIKVIALIHEKLYQSDNMAYINISEYTQSLLLLISGIYNHKNKIDVTCEIKQKITLNIDRAIPYGLLLTEIISNAYKHAFVKVETGVILVSLVQNENAIILSIKDNGEGIDTSIELNQRKSLGMKLIHSLSAQLKAKLTFHNENGLRITVEINNIN